MTDSINQGDAGKWNLRVCANVLRLIKYLMWNVFRIHFTSWRIQLTRKSADKKRIDIEAVDTLSNVENMP